MGSYFAGLTILGVLLALIFFFMYIFAMFRCCCFKHADNPFACVTAVFSCLLPCCCRSRAIKDDGTPEEEDTRSNSPATICRWINLISFLLLGGLFVILAFAAAGPGATMSTAAGQLVNASELISKHVQLVRSEASASYDAVQAGFRRSTDIVTSTQPSVLPADRNNANITAVAFSVVDTGTGDVFRSANNASQQYVRFDRGLGQYDSYPQTLGVTAAVVMGVIVLIFMITALVPHVLCRISHIGLSLLLIPLLLLGWLLTGAFISGSLVGADFCAAPNTTAATFLLTLPSNESLGLMLRSGAYYATCDHTPAVPASATFLGIVDATRATLSASAVASAANSLFTRSSTASGDARQAMIDVHHHYDAILGENGGSPTPGGSLGGLKDALACAPVNGLFYEAVRPLCDTIIGEAAMPFFELLIAALFFFTIFIGVNATFLIEHPATRKANADAAAAAAAADRVVGSKV